MVENDKYKIIDDAICIKNEITGKYDDVPLVDVCFILNYNLLSIHELQNKVDEYVKMSHCSISDGFTVENDKIVYFKEQIKPPVRIEFDNLDDIVKQLNIMANDNYSLMKQNIDLKNENNNLKDALIKLNLENLKQKTKNNRK